MFGSIKTTIVEYFDERYEAFFEATVATAISATGVCARKVFQYRDFDNTESPTFDGVHDLIYP